MNEVEILHNSLVVLDSQNRYEDIKEAELLKTKLIELIRKLLDEDFSRLLQLLYRVDVSEDKLKQAFVIHKEKEPSEIIAEMIIKRQREKLKWREWYKNRGA
ncbi:hypothetical protein KRX57_06010 [Weeksellaceae bacterium TAE3-ERU29]|nr:hypothetical protein [Weeksellaceae bacterium TAE3-ERU29]